MTPETVISWVGTIAVGALLGTMPLLFFYRVWRDIQQEQRAERQKAIAALQARAATRKTGIH